MGKGGRPKGSYSSWYREQIEEFLRSGEQRQILPPIEDKERAKRVYFCYFQIIKRGNYPATIHKDGPDMYLFRRERSMRT